MVLLLPVATIVVCGGVGCVFLATALHLFLLQYRKKHGKSERSSDEEYKAFLPGDDEESEDNLSEDNYTKPRNKVFRRRKSCTVETCEPCSLSADCMKWRHCLNKNLK